ncbi:MAG TPA: ABC transporter substrate-binding protein [Geminicoccaceae bacterium]|nr:ABC transporter substrate-binding protein [Geminicoccaceae bacterium]
MNLTRTGSAGPKLSRRLALLGGVAAAGAAFPGRIVCAAPTTADGSAQDFIRRLGDSTVAILGQPSAPPEKLQQLKRLLDQATDLELVARLVMGRYWRQASEAQRQEYVRLFKALVMRTMAERFSWYSGETFEVTGQGAVDERDTMVSTRIVRPDGKPPILVDWRVRRGERGYLLIDILAEGVSLVVTQRSEAAEVINRRGIDGLLAEMRARLAKRDSPSRA